MSRRPQFWLSGAVLGLFGLVAGCAPEKKPEMTDTCQLRECVCAKQESFWRLKEQKEVQWNMLGGPYCEEGYTLQIKSQKK